MVELNKILYLKKKVWFEVQIKIKDDKENHIYNEIQT